MKKVAVLLASYNGASFIHEQLTSILENVDVDIHVFVSDDGSTDGTYEIVKSFDFRRVTLLDGPRLKSAAQNFFSLLALHTWDAFDYVALADQDDIWHTAKLRDCINAIEESGAVAASSNVTAFWCNGRKKLIKKSHQQTRYDFFFESAGPGCTYVLKSSAARLIRDRLRKNSKAVSQVQAHDWLIYAIIRDAGHRWEILPKSTMLYRQHDNNVAGANSGVKSILKRLKAVATGWYTKDMDKIFALTTPPREITAAIHPRGMLPLIRLLLLSPELRRRPIEKVLIVPVLAIIYLTQSKNAIQNK